MNRQAMERIDVQKDGLSHEDIARRAGDLLNAGELVIFPTETVYGIGAAAASDAGYDALRHVKGRPDVQPFTVHAGSVDQALSLVDPRALDMRRILRKVLPGPVTLVVEVPDAVARERVAALGLPDVVVDRIYRAQTVGLRCPDHALARAMLAAADSPVLASSANRRGEPPPQSAQPAIDALGDQAGLIVDDGPTRYAMGSTVLRLAGKPPGVRIKIERQGVYDERFMRKLMRWTILLVCSGNTCRSPMAEALAKAMLADERGLRVSELDDAGIRVISAGTSTQAGLPAASHAVKVVEELGAGQAGLGGHQSRVLSRELIREADVIYCMTHSHRQAVLDLARDMPDVAARTYLLDAQGDIADPYGGPLAAYRQAAGQIHQALAQRFKER